VNKPTPFAVVGNASEQGSDFGSIVFPSINKNAGHKCLPRSARSCGEILLADVAIGIVLLSLIVFPIGAVG